jgi:bifunctional non-homologous end joining protein LigD
MSWALPKGKVPKKIGEKYLAVRTPDHRKEWLSFSGKIAADEYGGGTVSISQSGVLKIEKWEEDKIVFVIVGDKMNGRFSLIKLKKSKTDQEEWLLIKVKDKLKEYFINQFMNRII